MIIEKLKEKMINRSDPIMDVIISANSETGSPIITARFLMFLYTSNFFISTADSLNASWGLNNDTNEVSKNSNHCTRYQHEYQHTGNSFFQICVLTEKVTCIK